MKQNIWIDASHILVWQGNLTGIERVEYYLIKHYYDKTDAGFIAWDNNALQFLIVSRNEIKKQLIDRFSGLESQEINYVSHIISLFQRVKHKVRGGTIRKVAGNTIEDGTIIVLAGLWDNVNYIKGLQLSSKHHSIIHIVYDMIPILYPEFVVDYLPGIFANYMYSILPLCTQILTNSRATALDIKKLLSGKKLNTPDINLFRLGSNIDHSNKSVKPKEVNGDFILSVGTIEIRKNHKLLFETYKKLMLLEQDPPKLVFVGRRGWLTDELQEHIKNDIETKGKIILLDKSTDSELNWLYQNCLFTVFPSFYEGWGLPISESLNYHKVTLSSNTSSMPEVGGACADYFPPTSSEELVALIIKYINATTRAEREDYIKKNYVPLSWDKASEKFAELIS